MVSISVLVMGLLRFSILCQGGGFSRQEYWSVLANTGCHTLPEHYVPCCPSRNPPEYLLLPEPLRTKQLHHFHIWPSQRQTQALQGSLRSQTPVDDPHVEVEIKPQLKHRGSVAKEEDPKPSHQLYKLQIEST